MSVIAEFRVRSPDLALGAALAAVPEIRLDLVQEVGTDPDRPYLLAWASGGDMERFEAAMDDDETVSEVERYLEVDEKVLYRMRVTEATEVVSYPVWVELGGEQLDAYYADGWWHNRMRLPSHDALAQLRDWCGEAGVTFDLIRVYADDADGSSALTEPQREALKKAYTAGFFEVPRDTSMTELADSLDVSGQAVSERLRRAHRTLVASHFSDISSD